MGSGAFRTALLACMLAVSATSIPQPAESPRPPSPTPNPGGQAGLNDAQISAVARGKLILDQISRPKQLKVQVKNGVVEVSGTLDNLQSKERALRAIESIRGVTSVHNRIEVKAPQRPDETIRNDFLQAIRTDPLADWKSPNVRVSQGILTLQGMVPSSPKRKYLEWVARGISGVRGVQNDLRVEAQGPRPDAEIANDIRGRIKQDPWLDHSPLQVEARGGNVSIRGEVETYAQRSRAQAYAWVEGTRSIDLSGVRIKQQRGGISPLKALPIETPESIARRDRAIQQAGRAADTLIDEARKAISSDPVLSQERITLSPEGEGSGSIVIQGTVASGFTRWLAEDVVSKVRGVRAVKNEIYVLSTPEQLDPENDAVVTRSILSVLATNPLVGPRSQITVTVREGVATLTGVVEDYAEKSAVVRDAFGAGAKLVIDHLRIQGLPESESQQSSSNPPRSENGEILYGP